MKYLFQELGVLAIYYVLIISCVKDFWVIWDVRDVGGELVGEGI